MFSLFFLNSSFHFELPLFSSSLTYCSAFIWSIFYYKHSFLSYFYCNFYSRSFIFYLYFFSYILWSSFNFSIFSDSFYGLSSLILVICYLFSSTFFSNVIFLFCISSNFFSSLNNIYSVLHFFSSPKISSPSSSNYFFISSLSSWYFTFSNTLYIAFLSLSFTYSNVKRP